MGANKVFFGVTWMVVACVRTYPLPQKKKSGEETLLLIFSEGRGTSVHRLGWWEVYNLVPAREKRLGDEVGRFKY